MLISGATVDSRTLCDSGDTQSFLAFLSQHFSRGLENCLARALRIPFPSSPPDFARMSFCFCHRVVLVCVRLSKRVAR